VSRPTPDRPDADLDEDVLSRLVSEAGDTTVEPRPEHVADLRALILDRLGPPHTRMDWSPGKRWLAISGLVAACLAAVLAWPRGDGTTPVRGLSGQQASDPITPRRTQDPNGVAAWASVRRGLNLSEMPAYSWPLQDSSHLSGITSIPRDLLD
jgi:hypothetical protein